MRGIRLRILNAVDRRKDLAQYQSGGNICIDVDVSVKRLRSVAVITWSVWDCLSMEATVLAVSRRR